MGFAKAVHGGVIDLTDAGGTEERESHFLSDVGLPTLCALTPQGSSPRLSECPLKYILRKVILHLVSATHKACALLGENTHTGMFLLFVFGVSPDILSFINFWSFMAFEDFISQAVSRFSLLPNSSLPNTNRVHQLLAVSSSSAY